MKIFKFDQDYLHFYYFASFIVCFSQYLILEESRTEFIFMEFTNLL